MSRRNKKRFVVALIACVIGIPLVIIAKIAYFPVIYPTRSSPHTLSIVLYSGFYPNKPVITLKHYVEGIYVADYTLTIENGVQIEEPQSYDLPGLTEGMVEVSIEWNNEVNSSFTVVYTSAGDLHKRGLLIYLTDNKDKISFDYGKEKYDRYVYFVSGGEERCYFKESTSSEWSEIMHPPQLKMFPKRFPEKLIIIYSGWKENEWVIEKVNK